MVPKIRPTTEQFYLEQLKEIIAAKIEQVSSCCWHID